LLRQIILTLTGASPHSLTISESGAFTRRSGKAFSKLGRDEVLIPSSGMSAPSL